MKHIETAAKARITETAKPGYYSFNQVEYKVNILIRRLCTAFKYKIKSPQVWPIALKHPPIDMDELYLDLQDAARESGFEMKKAYNFLKSEGMFQYDFILGYVYISVIGNHENGSALKNSIRISK